jgi:hypothetical protein
VNYLRSSSVLRSPPHARPRVECLETRIVPYVTSGNSWPHPDLVTISFVPDNTILGSNGGSYLYSNLFAKFNAKFGSAATWENVILKAAQSWAAQTNINFAQVSDNGTTYGQGNYQQGDPGMGDIRIGGYNFGNGTLAVAFMPPPINNYSAAGDIEINTGAAFNIGSTYDLFTVTAHEIGHALGLAHSATSTAVMYGTYNGIKSSLTSDDINGIRNIYSSNNPRSADSYDSGSGNNTFATASNISSSIDPVALTALVQNLDITTTSDVDYYTFTAPSGSASTLTVNVQSSGLSLLAPNVTVYASDQTTVLGSASGAGHYGTTLTVTVTGVSAGQQFYVKVAGADSTVLGTGAYALTLNLGTSSSPTVPLPNTQTPNGSPLSGGGGSFEVPGVETPGSDSFNPAAAQAAIAVSALPPQGTATGTVSVATHVPSLPISTVGAQALVIAPSVSAARMQPTFATGGTSAATTSNPLPVALTVATVNHDVASGGGDAAAAPSADAPPALPQPSQDEAPAATGEATRAPAVPESHARDAYFAEGLWDTAEKAAPTPKVVEGAGVAAPATLAVPLAMLIWSVQPEARDERRGQRIVKR